MADESLNIKVTVSGKETVKALRDEIRAVELGWKAGTVATDKAKTSYQNIARELLKVKGAEHEVLMASGALWHANNRVEIGFKSLATETVALNKKMLAFNQEQKIGNALLGGLSSQLSNLGVPGGQFISMFQGMEQSVSALGIAAQSSTSKVAALGVAMKGMATSLAGLGALAFAEFTLFSTMLDRVEAANNRLRKARGATEREGSTGFMGWLAKLAGGASGNSLLDAIGAFAKAVVDTEHKAWAEEHQIMMEEIVVVGKVKKAHEEKNKEKYGPSAAYGIGDFKRVGGRGYGGGYEGTTNPRLGNPYFKSGGGSSKEPIKEAERELSAFENMAVGSFARVGQTIGQTIGQGFVNAFGIGHTLLGQFIADMASQFLSFAASGILNSIFGFATGGFGGIFTGLFGGASGGSASIPGRAGGFTGGTLLSPIRSTSGGGSINLRGVLRGSDIYLAQERGGRVVKSRRN